MGYRERAEKAVVAMFEHDRKLDEKIKKLFGNADDCIQDALNLESCCDIALDLLGIPQDNTLDYDYNNPALKGEWPEGCFCRDAYMDLWLRDADAQEFLIYCRKALKEFAEQDMVFTKPRI